MYSGNRLKSLLGKCLTKLRQWVRVLMASALTDGHWSRRWYTCKTNKWRAIRYEMNSTKLIMCGLNGYKKRMGNKAEMTQETKPQSNN